MNVVLDIHKGKTKIVLQVDFDVHVQPNVLAPFIDDGYESNEVLKNILIVYLKIRLIGGK